MNKNVQISGDTATLFMYGYIGDDWWGDGSGSADIDIARDLKALEGQVKRMDVRMNCLGGSVKHAWGIYNYIQSSPIEVHVYNDGWVCSATGIIYLSVPVENRHYGELALWMYHPVISAVMGNVWDFEDEIEVMKLLHRATAEMLNQKTTSPVDWMETRKDTWLTIDDAISHGLIQRQDPYKIEPVEKTLLSDKQVNKGNKAISQMVMASFNNYQNTCKMEAKKDITSNVTDPQKQSDAVTPPVEANADITALSNRLTQMEARQVEQATKITGLEQSLQQKEQEIVQKAAEIEDLKKIVDAKPGTTPQQVTLNEPITPKEDDYVDPFTQMAQKGEYRAVN